MPRPTQGHQFLEARKQCSAPTLLTPLTPWSAPQLCQDQDQASARGSGFCLPRRPLPTRPSLRYLRPLLYSFTHTRQLRLKLRQNRSPDRHLLTSPAECNCPVLCAHIPSVFSPNPDFLLPPFWGPPQNRALPFLMSSSTALLTAPSCPSSLTPSQQQLHNYPSCFNPHPSTA